MRFIKKNILLTGLPGIGKTTIVRQLSEELKTLNPVGFYTEEIRQKDIRKGFALVTLDGRRGLLSHTEIESPYRVGRYRVDVKGFEGFLDAIAFFDPKTSLIVIDEIGKMECLSQKFRILIEQILDSKKLTVATIAFKGGGIIKEIKKREDVTVFEVKKDNRDILMSEILVCLQDLINYEE